MTPWGAHDLRGKMRPGLLPVPIVWVPVRTKAARAAASSVPAGAERRKDERDQLSSDRSAVACIGKQRTKQKLPVRVALLPFVDLLGKPTPQTAAFTDLLLSRLIREDELLVKITVRKARNVLDRETALNLGKKQGASLLLIGRIDAADTRQSNNGLPLPTLGRVNSQSSKAEVAAEIDVISVSSGKTLETLRSVGKKTVRSNQTWINSRAGDIHMGGSGSPTSPVGQAMSECSDKLVRQLLQVSRKAP